MCDFDMDKKVRKTRAEGAGKILNSCGLDRKLKRKLP